MAVTLLLVPLIPETPLRRSVREHEAHRCRRDHGPRAPAPNVTLAVLALSALAFSLLQSLVAPALPAIQHDLGARRRGVAWILTVYLLSASVATPLIGRLGDIHGKERVLFWVLVALAAGTLVSALATSLSVLLVGRVIQGVGGGVFPLAFGIIRDEFPRERVAGSIGLISAIFGIGGGAGLVLAGVLVDNLSYHWLFWVPLVAVVVAAVATALFVPESPVKASSRINWLGAALLSAGLAAVLLAISEAPSWGWGSARTIGLTAFGFVVLAIWVWVELRSRYPLVDMRVMQLPAVWRTNLVAFLLGAGMYSSFILIPQLVELPKSTGFGFGASVTAAGLFLVPSTAMMLWRAPSPGGWRPASAPSRRSRWARSRPRRRSPCWPSPTTRASTSTWARRCSGSGSAWPSRRWRTSSSRPCHRTRPASPPA